MSIKSIQSLNRPQTLPDKFDDQERKLWQGRFSARSQIGGWVGASVISGLLLAARWSIPALQENPLVGRVMIVMIALLWIVLIGMIVIGKSTRRYALTSQRLFLHHGILIRKLDCIDLMDVDEVIYHQGPLQSLFNVGRIELSIAGKNNRRQLMPGIARVRQVSDQIDQARRIERLAHGISETSVR